MSVENDIKILCESVLRLDEEGLKKFNLSREDLYNNWTGAFVKSMRENSRNMFSKNHAMRIGNAMMDALSKVAVDTRTTEDESKVKVIVNGLDIANEFAGNIQLDADVKASPKEIVESITKAMVKKFEEMKLSKSKAFTVDCVYSEEEKVWKPKDLQEFFTTLSASAMGNE